MPYYYPTTQRRRRYAAPVRTRYTGSGAYQRRVYQPRRYARRIYGNGAYTYDNPGPYGRVGEFLGGHIGNYVAPAVLVELTDLRLVDTLDTRSASSLVQEHTPMIQMHLSRVVQ